MKILWVVNSIFPEAYALLMGKEMASGVSGGWVLGAAAELIKVQEVDLSVACVSPLVKEFTSLRGEKANYYILPSLRVDVKYDVRQEPHWRRVKELVKPDVIHIHGTEYAHSLSFVRACGPDRVCVSIQGMKSVISDYYYAGLSAATILRNLTFRDMVCGSLYRERRTFKKSGAMERELLSQVGHVIGRTSWDKSHVWAINPNAQYHFCNETLRSEFYGGEKWSYEKCRKHTVFVSQASCPIKGLHQLLSVLPLVLRHYPETKVRVAGLNLTKMPWYRIRGYGKILKKTISDLGLQEVVSFTGCLNPEGMKREYLDANLFVSLSAIENSSNSLGEAQILGVPVLASYVGGTMDLMEGNEQALYRFEEGIMLAQKICAVFENEGRQVDMSSEAYERHNPVANVRRLLNIYKSMIDSQQV